MISEDAVQRTEASQVLHVLSKARSERGAKRTMVKSSRVEDQLETQARLWSCTCKHSIPAATNISHPMGRQSAAVSNDAALSVGHCFGGSSQRSR